MKRFCIVMIDACVIAVTLLSVLGIIGLLLFANIYLSRLMHTPLW